LDFRFYRLRFEFLARGELRFPASGAANVIRGAFGLALRRTALPDVYERIFEPRPAGPSGLHRPPRPFVIRAHASAQEAVSSKSWRFGLNVFETNQNIVDAIVFAVHRMAAEGLGPSRIRSDLVAVVSSLCSVDLSTPEPASQVRVRFVTNTELKAGGQLSLDPAFAHLFARIRDRISNLSALYGPGPLDIDFRALGRRAADIRLIASRLKHVTQTRRSSRTGEIHPLGGFTGEAIYAGDLSEFLPYLRAAQYTGVGRQAVWGKGEIEVEPE
jgi:CRISPR/Cas system endoribonuclease Cas6 (RAMP superfamily)